MKRLARKDVLRAACAVVLGAALLQGSKWIMLHDSMDITIGALLFSRYIGLACCLALAIFFRSRPPELKPALVVGCVLMALYLAVQAGGTLVADATLARAFSYCGGLAYGIADALFTLVFMQAFARFEPRISSLAIISSQLLVNLVMVLFTALPAAALHGTRALCIILGTSVLVIGAYQVAKKQAESVQSGQDGLSAPAAPPAAAASPAAEFPANVVSWIVFFAVGFGFSTLFGVMAQISSATGGSFALYDLVTNVVLVMMDVLLLIVLVFYGQSISFVVITVVCGILYMFAFVTYGYFWNEGNMLAGVILRIGYDYSTVLLKVLVLRRAYSNPKAIATYVGLTWLFTTVYPGRSLGVLLMSNTTNQAALVAAVAQISIMIVFVLILAAVLFASSRFSLGASAKNTSSAADAFSPAEDHSHVTRENDARVQVSTETGRRAYQDQLEALGRQFGLSSREQEVFAELVAGRSRNVIAEKLYLSPGTVKAHISHIYVKAGVSSKQELLDKVEAYLHQDPRQV